MVACRLEIRYACFRITFIIIQGAAILNLILNIISRSETTTKRYKP